MREAELMGYFLAGAIVFIVLFTVAGVIYDSTSHPGPIVKWFKRIQCRVLGHWDAPSCPRGPCIHCGRMKREPKQATQEEA